MLIHEVADAVLGELFDGIIELLLHVSYVCPEPHGESYSPWPSP